MGAPESEWRGEDLSAAPGVPQSLTLEQQLEAVNDVRGRIIFAAGALEALLTHYDRVLGLGATEQLTPKAQCEQLANFQSLFECVLEARVRPLLTRAEDLEFLDLRVQDALREAD